MLYEVITIGGPSYFTIDVTIKGRAAHAGMEPEKGINAIQAAAKAISKLKLGRLVITSYSIHYTKLYEKRILGQEDEILEIQIVEEILDPLPAGRQIQRRRIGRDRQRGIAERDLQNDDVV